MKFWLFCVTAFVLVLSMSIETEAQSPYLPIVSTIKTSYVDPTTNQIHEIEIETISTIQEMADNVVRYQYTITNKSGIKLRFIWRSVEESNFRRVAMDQISRKELKPGKSFTVVRSSSEELILNQYALEIYTTGKFGRQFAMGGAPAFAPKEK